MVTGWQKGWDGRDGGDGWGLLNKTLKIKHLTLFKLKTFDSGLVLIFSCDEQLKN